MTLPGAVVVHPRASFPPDPEVPYEDLIGAMDAVRGEDNELFPDVLLSAGIR